ncbi:hypothetical protein [Parabacteroides pacaensis]|uniref:hypothetical protein n=1 Tax=Parabacteroides pacaensis TaxID=2086575 RepID=UPI000D0FEE9F|nr:hypothetical protein [Parabacteroides pacaensis]
MGFKVDKYGLLFIAGTLWIIVGINILRIGLLTWMSDPHFWLVKIGGALIIFLLFFFLVFRKLYNKHSYRISQKKDKSCPFSFFDKKSWMIMVFMIILGIGIRKFHWMPNAFISVFYTGLSSALIITGVLFLRRGWIEKRNNTLC